MDLQIIMRRLADNGVAVDEISKINEFIEGYKLGYRDGVRDMVAGKTIEPPKEKIYNRVRHPRRTREEYTRQVRFAIEDTPNITQDKLYDRVGGARKDLITVLRGLMDGKVVRRAGTGKRGSLFTYSLYPEAKRSSIITRRPDGTAYRVEHVGNGDGKYPLGQMAHFK